MNDSRLLARAVKSGREGVTRLRHRTRCCRACGARSCSSPRPWPARCCSAASSFASALLGVVDGTPSRCSSLALLAAVALFVALSLFGDVTSWSLHPFYRRRLATAFALRRIAGGDRAVAEERDYGSFVPLSRSGVEPVEGEQKPREWPQLVVCAAANVSDPGADAARPAGDELHVQPADDRRAADRLRVDAGVRGAARGPPPRLHADGRRGDVRRRPLPLDGQADALAAALPAHARQRPARRLGPQPAPPRPAGHRVVAAAPAPAPQRAAGPQLGGREVPLRDRRRPLREPRARRAAAPRLPRRLLLRRQRRQRHPGARRRDRARPHRAPGRGRADTGGGPRRRAGRRRASPQPTASPARSASPAARSARSSTCAR